MRKISWAIDRHGDLVCSATGYYITRDSLDKQDWIDHMQSKRWVDMADFIPKYKEACRRAGITRVPRGYQGAIISLDEI